MKVWNGETPQHTVAVKLDGIQAMLKDNSVVSRSGKPLFNIDPDLLDPGKRYEIYLGSFKQTTSVLRTYDHTRKVTADEVFEIYPGTDKRLILDKSGDIKELFQAAVAQGFEGLVIDQTYKLKTVETHDVPIIDIIPGRGKHTGRMGALLTPMGKVGTGFSDADRERNWTIGELIEVECMEVTAAGKFRMPRFVRLRWDKD